MYIEIIRTLEGPYNQAQNDNNDDYYRIHGSGKTSCHRIIVLPPFHCELFGGYLVSQ